MNSMPATEGETEENVWDQNEDQKEDDNLRANPTVVPPQSASPRRARARRRSLPSNAPSWESIVVPVLSHVVILALYLIPIFWNDEKTPTAVLDEIHLTDGGQQKDIYDPQATWTQIFTNDYWGRPMNSHSSHKSWRPLTVLTFRYFRSFLSLGRWKHQSNDVHEHRVWNVLTHAAIAEGVSLLAVRLIYSFTPQRQRQQYHNSRWLLLRTLTKLIFALHPTHVEVTANAANRPHLLAVLWAVWLCDAPLWSYPLLLTMGFLSSETFLFGIVPVAVIRGILLVREASLARSSFVFPWRPLLLTWIILGSSGIFYYALRYHLDWLNIPDGLIRPAENPFYRLTGWDRVRSYAFITLVVHVGKAWDADMIGFSHEYGVACITPITTWADPRLCATAVVAILYTVVTLVGIWRAWSHWKRRNAVERRYHPVPVWFLLWIVHLSWMVTLFPIAGIVKVGTFVADRIVVPASVGTSILMAQGLTMWLCRHHDKRGRVVFWNPWHWSWREGLVLLLLIFSWRRIQKRIHEWMGPVALLESSLRTCPQSAKSHLEYSKTLSGLFPARTNLTQARWHLQQVERIDPTYCDVHQQLAHVAVQEQQYVEFEKHLTQAVLCPFTMGGAMETWKRYWAMALDPKQNGEAAVTAARARQKEYMKVIDAAIEAEAAADQERREKSASPLVWKQ